MIDIHSHILQGVDDGSEDLEMSLSMAKIYLENGVEKVIATPHYIEKDDSSLNRNKAALDLLREELKKEQIDLEVYLGNEVYISMDILKDIEEKRVATLNNSRYVLIEFPMMEIPIYAESIFYELLIKGYIPILAHPERYMKIQEDPNILLDFVKKGALAQINLPSLEGFYGQRAKDTAKILLEHRMVDFVGTDTHTDRRRSPEVRESLDILESIVSKGDYKALTRDNAQSILEDRVFTSFTPREYKRKKLFGLFNFKRK